MPQDAKLSNANSTLSQLIDAFLPYIEKKATESKGCGLDRDDVVQEGLIGLFGAIRGYEPDKGAEFTTYAYSCINNSIVSALRAAGRKKHSMLNSALPIEAADGVSGGETPEQTTISNESLRDLREKIQTLLSPLERKVLTLRLSGKSYVEIADRLSRTQKSVDNAVQRIRRKLKS